MSDTVRLAETSLQVVIVQLTIVAEELRPVDVPAAELVEAAITKAQIAATYLRSKYPAVGVDANGSLVP